MALSFSLRGQDVVIKVTKRPEFEVCIEPSKYAGFCKFRVGTCHGLYRVVNDAFEILAVVNTKKGNGHFRQAMHYFEHSAKTGKVMVRVLECWNPWLSYKLRKHGYIRKSRTLFTYEKLCV